MNQVEQKLNSREVAEMMETQHKDLLKKIDRINKDFGSEKIRHEKYWIEGTFESRGKEYREFQITKRGCEFLAHKTTGTKGNLFTDRYMDRFSEMEQRLSNPISNIDFASQMLNVAQGTQVIAQVVQSMTKAMSGLQEFVQDSIQIKDKQIDDIAEMIGLRSKNTHALTGKLKEVLSKKYKIYNIKSSMEVYQKAKNSILRNSKFLSGKIFQ
jgi:phage regulator Rha-like protein